MIDQVIAPCADAFGCDQIAHGEGPDRPRAPPLGALRFRHCPILPDKIEPMRVLIAPDKFAGTLTAPQAAEAIAHGWRGQAPDDELDLAPMSDGGPGFVDVLHAALGGELLATPTHPTRTSTPPSLRARSSARISATACPSRCT